MWAAAGVSLLDMEDLRPVDLERVNQAVREYLEEARGDGIT